MAQRLSITDTGLFISFDTRILRVIARKSRVTNAMVSRAQQFLITAMNKTQAQIHAWSTRQKQRRQLASLSDYALKDMGLNRIDANNEANKPFWQQ